MECGVWSVEYGVWSMEYGVRSTKFRKNPKFHPLFFSFPLDFGGKQTISNAVACVSILVYYIWSLSGFLAWIGTVDDG